MVRKSPVDEPIRGWRVCFTPLEWSRELVRVECHFPPEFLAGFQDLSRRHPLDDLQSSNACFRDNVSDEEDFNRASQILSGHIDRWDGESPEFLKFCAERGHNFYDESEQA